MNNYETYDNNTVDVIIEMGLGACIAELEALATELEKVIACLYKKDPG